MENFTTGLTKAETERLALLVEECAEVQQVAMKILRHGYGSYNPFDKAKTPNRELLNKEIGHLNNAVTLMCECADINGSSINQAEHIKRGHIQDYLHHNTI